jgi:hypothetical protein
MPSPPPRVRGAETVGTDGARRRVGSAAAAAAGISLLVLSGCVTIGPGTILRDRFDYATTIGESSKAQTLLNIVKLRYADWPTFLELNQVVAGYNIQHTGNAEIGLRSGAGLETGSLGYSGQYIERPTITYTPLAGEKFVRSILTSVRPEILLSLIQSGWQADAVVRIMVHAVNGVPNPGREGATKGREPSAFTRFAHVLRAAQLAGAITTSFGEVEHPTVLLGLRRQRLDAQTLAELRQVEDELQLDPGVAQWRIVWETGGVDPSTLALQTRTVGQVLVDLASYVEVPDEHVRRGVVEASSVISGGDRPAETLLRIHSGPTRPLESYVAVEYLDTWFWIDIDDMQSKRTFTYVLLLLTITEAGSTSTPQLTISTN